MWPFILSKLETEFRSSGRQIEFETRWLGVQDHRKALTLRVRRDTLLQYVYFSNVAFSFIYIYVYICKYICIYKKCTYTMTISGPNPAISEAHTTSRDLSPLRLEGLGERGIWTFVEYLVSHLCEWRRCFHSGMLSKMEYNQFSFAWGMNQHK